MYLTINRWIIYADSFMSIVVKCGKHKKLLASKQVEIENNRKTKERTKHLETGFKAVLVKNINCVVFFQNRIPSFQPFIHGSGSFSRFAQ